MTNFKLDYLIKILARASLFFFYVKFISPLTLYFKNKILKYMIL